MALRVSHRGGPGCWEGVLRAADGSVAWACGHHHANRNQSTFTSGRAATSCAGLMLMLIEKPDYLQTMREWTQRYARSRADFETVRLLEAFAPVADELRRAK